MLPVIRDINEYQGKETLLIRVWVTFPLSFVFGWF